MKLLAAAYLLFFVPVFATSMFEDIPSEKLFFNSDSEVRSQENDFKGNSTKSAETPVDSMKFDGILNLMKGMFGSGANKDLFGSGIMKDFMDPNKFKNLFTDETMKNMFNPEEIMKMFNPEFMKNFLENGPLKNLLDPKTFGLNYDPNHLAEVISENRDVLGSLANPETLNAVLGNPAIRKLFDSDEMTALQTGNLFEELAKSLHTSPHNVPEGDEKNLVPEIIDHLKDILQKHKTEKRKQEL